MPAALIILAAGLGSRYGALKQLEPVGPSGETLLDYTIHDGLAAGFERLVFVIRREIEAPFRAWTRRFGERAEIRFAPQELGGLPPGYRVPPGRAKPWGTGHALLAAEPFVEGACGLVNADDFYGAAALETLAALLSQPGPDTHHALVTFRLADTLSSQGKVSRGVCRVAGGQLSAIEETLEIERAAEAPTTLRGRRAGRQVLLTGEEPVSMNLWGFRRGVFAPLRRQFARFLDRHGQDLAAEFFLPDALREMIEAGEALVRVAPAASSWVGLTHRDDRAEVAARLAAWHRSGVYPTPLWAA